MIYAPTTMIFIFFIVLSMSFLSMGCKNNSSGIPGTGSDQTKELHPEIFASNLEERERTGKYFSKHWIAYMRSSMQLTGKATEFEVNFDALPLSGSASFLPYAGFYYPYVKGGVNFKHGNERLSPLQKYDRAFNPHGSSAEWEKKFHSEGDKWFGHCNGIAAAAQRHKEPESNVEIEGVVFTPMDIKALLSEIYLKTKYQFLGGNRCEKTEQAVEEENKQHISDGDKTLSDCEDVNAGTLHLLLTNWIGVNKQVIIMDRSIDFEIWNFPVYKYDMLCQSVNAFQAQNILGGGTGKYSFNDDAVNFKRCKLAVHYRDMPNNYEIIEVPSNQYLANLELEYILELDSDMDVIGGEWIGNSRRIHPDFIWIAYEPIEFDRNAVTGEENVGVNPFLDPHDVLKLWAQSTGLNVEKGWEPRFPSRFRGVENQWGKTDRIKAILGGFDRGGAYYKQKPIPMQVELNSDMESDGSLQLRVRSGSGTSQSLTLSKSEPVKKVELTPYSGVGLNTVRFDVYSDSDQTWVEESEFYFHVLP